MSNLVTVWDLEGTPFEVSRANATDLTTHLKWTFHDPKSKKEKAPAPKPAPEAVVETPAVEAVEESSPEETEEAGNEAPTQEEASPKRGRPRKA